MDLKCKGEAYWNQIFCQCNLFVLYLNTGVMAVSEIPSKQGNSVTKPVSGTKTSHRETLQPCTNMCVPVTHEKVVHFEQDFAFWKFLKSDFFFVEENGFSLWDFAFHNRCDADIPIGGNIRIH